MADELVEQLMWQIEQCLGPISREVCENPGDDDYSVLRHNVTVLLADARGKAFEEAAQVAETVSNNPSTTAQTIRDLARNNPTGN